MAEFGARGDGTGDDTSAFQQACDQLAGGGTLHVPAGTYRLNSVAIRHRNIRVLLAPDATLQKIPPAGPTSRGIFVLSGLSDAGFELRGGTIDLRGEGPMKIGRPGLLRNLYASQMISSITCIAGPANAAVFALRSSGIAIRDCAILNSGESGLLFRNSGAISVRGCRFSNLANYGVEFSYVVPENDGGSGAMPPFTDCEVADCRFEDIDDYGLGSGNGVAVGGGGVGRLRTVRDVRISDCTFTRCNRDIHFEFLDGSWMEQVDIARVTSREPRQGSIGLVSARRASISDVVIEDPSNAPTALLIPEKPDLYGIVLSSGFSDVTLSNVTIRDRRERMVSGTGASLERGSTRLRTSTNVFRTADVGTWIGIAGGNPQGTVYVGRVTAVVSPREVELDLPAGATVRGGRFALGGMVRNGVILTAGADVVFDNVRIEAGVAGDSPSRAEAAAVRLRGMNGEVRFNRTTLRAPESGARPAGVRITGGRARVVGLENVRIEGFALPILDAT